MVSYKILEEKDIELMKDFVDDEHTKYDKVLMSIFLEEKNAYGFIAKAEDKIIGFAYGYKLVKPDGRSDFYLHAIDITEGYQGRGYGTEFVKYIQKYSKSIGCCKMFLITNRSNVPACICYEKAGGVNKADDEAVYVYNDDKEML